MYREEVRQQKLAERDITTSKKENSYQKYK